MMRTSEDNIITRIVSNEHGSSHWTWWQPSRADLRDDAIPPISIVDLAGPHCAGVSCIHMVFPNPSHERLGSLRYPQHVKLMLRLLSF